MPTGVQVLVATVDQTELSLHEKMNLRSDAVICNQCGRNGADNVEYNGFDVKYFHSDGRGVGLNRNNCLLNATGKICIIADDDIRYYDDYAEQIEKAFAEHPSVDFIVFNIDEPQRKKPYVIEKAYWVNYRNYMRFATFRFAFKRESVEKCGALFNLSFGGGAEYSHGEDTLFLGDCMRRGLKVMALPITLGVMTYERRSTWFKGFDCKYFNDQGALYAAISRKLWRFLCLQDLIRHRRKYASHGGILRNYRVMKAGAREYLVKNKEK